MRIPMLYTTSKAAWAALGVWLMLVMSCPVLCDEAVPDTPSATASPEIDRQQYRATHLPWAVEANPEIVGEMIRNGEDVNATDEDGVSALHLAVLHDHYGIAELLLDRGANVNAKEHSRAGGFCGWGWYPLHLALRNENRDMINLLIDHGADVNAVRSDGWTPLNTAASHGQPDVVELLIAKGADVTVYDSEPLRTAILGGKLEAARVMIEHGANVNGRRGSGQGGNGETPLIIATYCNNLSTAKLLLDNNANANLADNNGKTPLFYAADAGHLAMVKLLISKGANVNARAKDNTSILQSVIGGKKAFLASEYDKKDLAGRDWYGVRRVLLRHGAEE